MVLDHFIHNPNSHEKRCLIEFDDVPIGYIQMYPVDSEWKTLYGYEESQHVWEWINLLEKPTYWEKALERNSFRQQLHILWRTRSRSHCNGPESK